MDGQAIRPGRWLYGLAGVMIVVGILLAVAGVATFAGTIGTIHKMGEEMHRVVVPGAATVTLDKAGSYVIYHEHQSVVGGQTFSNPPALSGLTVTLIRKETRQPVSLSGVTMSETYALGSRAGVAVWHFDIEKAGEYQLSATYAPGATGPPAVLAVGPPAMQMVRGMFGRIMGVIASVFGFILLGGGGLAIILVTYFKRRSARKRLAQAQPARA